MGNTNAEGRGKKPFFGVYAHHHDLLLLLIHLVEDVSVFWFVFWFVLFFLVGREAVLEKVVFSRQNL